jgi:hypothetical protein
MGERGDFSGATGRTQGHWASGPEKRNEELSRFTFCKLKNLELFSNVN